MVVRRKNNSINRLREVKGQRGRMSLRVIVPISKERENKETGGKKNPEGTRKGQRMEHIALCNIESLLLKQQQSIQRVNTKNTTAGG